MEIALLPPVWWAGLHAAEGRAAHGLARPLLSPPRPPHPCLPLPRPRLLLPPINGPGPPVPPAGGARDVLGNGMGKGRLL